MNFQFYVEKLFDSEEFQNFLKENKDAYPCGGFFVVDLENLKNPDNKNSIDYFSPSINKMFSFKFEKGVEKTPVENFGGKIPEKIKLNYNFEFEEIEDLIRKKMEEEQISKGIQKMLFSLQARENKCFLVGTVFISGMGILNLVIDLEERNIIEFSRKSFMDMISILKKQ